MPKGVLLGVVVGAITAVGIWGLTYASGATAAVDALGLFTTAVVGVIVGSIVGAMAGASGENDPDLPDDLDAESRGGGRRAPAPQMPKNPGTPRSA
jgi:hypothetical protein